MHHKIDTIAYESKLRSQPSEGKIIFGLLLLLMGYGSPMYVSLIIIVWLIWWVVIHGGVRLKIYGELMAIPLGFWLLSLPPLIIGVSLKSPSEALSMNILWSWNLGQIWCFITEEGVIEALRVLVRTICLTSGIYFILLTTPLPEIVRVMEKWGFPDVITELLLLMYRFIFLLSETAEELLTAQKSRYGYDTWKTSLKSISLLVGQLLQRTLNNYREISLGLASRGFNGKLRVWHSQPQQINSLYLYEAVGGYGFLLILWMAN